MTTPKSGHPGTEGHEGSLMLHTFALALADGHRSSSGGRGGAGGLLLLILLLYLLFR